MTASTSAVQCQRQYLMYDLTRDYGENRQGPALLTKLSNHIPSILRPFYRSGKKSSSDRVVCMQCLSWPTQAADWPARRRKHGWPDSATVGRVVSNGCDVVCVAHRLCRQDQWMSKFQWRLSFSRAEIILLNSWLPVQQIIHHMLRSFLKTERLADITDSTGSKILSNYNIKTLMLWACEMKGRSWWIDELNVVGICVELLHILAVWLTDARLPHYFINNCNLFDCLKNSHLTQKTANRLMSVTEAWSAEWFVSNYVCKCVDLCDSDEVLRLFYDISTHVKLQNAVSALHQWRLRHTLKAAYVLFETADSDVHTWYCRALNLRKCL